MKDLFSAPPRRRPSLVGTGLSILLHAAVVVGGFSLIRFNSSMPRTIAEPPRTVFVSLRAMPVEFQMPHAPLLMPQTVAESHIPEPKIVVPEALSPKRDEPRAPVEAAVKPSVARKPDPLPPLLDPKPRPVVVGMFEGGTGRSEAVQTSREIRAAGFDAAPARAPELKIGPAKVGAFDSSAGVADPRPGTDRPTESVAVGRFSNASGVAAPALPTDRLVVNAGFGSAQTRPPAATSPPAEIRAAGFDSQLVVPTSSRKDLAVARRLDTPVEVIFKPLPDYTEEARALKIEGDVILEVEFTADGKVHVIRAIRGLGHGLDAAAVRAAEQIRFKPAQSGGQPADVRTTVHIVFRLT